jgi:hypothetical protein
MSIIPIFIVIIVIFTVLYYFPMYKGTVLVTEVGPFPLNANTSVITSSQAAPFYSSSNGSVAAFIYVNRYNGKGIAPPVTAITNSGGDPTSSCSCGTTNDCTASCRHEGYSMIMNISGIVWLETIATPDASRQGLATIQLVVKTEGQEPSSGQRSSSTYNQHTALSTSQKYIETIPLPPIKMQKWTYLTIAREGRRFDVYYNDKLVVTQKTSFMPVATITAGNMAGITSGSSIDGQIALITLFNTRLTNSQVAANYATYADSRGMPFVNSSANTILYSPTISTNITSYIPNINLCPNGGCLNPPAINPPSALYKWTPSY